MTERLMPVFFTKSEINRVMLVLNEALNGDSSGRIPLHNRLGNHNRDKVESALQKLDEAAERMEDSE